MKKKMNEKKIVKNMVSCAAGAGAMRAVATRAAIPILAPVVAPPLALPVLPVIAVGAAAMFATSWLLDKVLGE